MSATTLKREAKGYYKVTLSFIKNTEDKVKYLLGKIQETAEILEDGLFWHYLGHPKLRLEEAKSKVMEIAAMAELLFEVMEGGEP